MWLIALPVVYAVVLYISTYVALGLLYEGISFLSKTVYKIQTFSHWPLKCTWIQFLAIFSVIYFPFNHMFWNDNFLSISSQNLHNPHWKLVRQKTKLRELF